MQIAEGVELQADERVVRGVYQSVGANDCRARGDGLGALLRLCVCDCDWVKVVEGQGAVDGDILPIAVG